MVVHSPRQFFESILYRRLLLRESKSLGSIEIQQEREEGEGKEKRIKASKVQTMDFLSNKCGDTNTSNQKTFFPDLYRDYPELGLVLHPFHRLLFIQCPTNQLLPDKKEE